jgi:peptide/nickel transport system permease protein
MPPSIWVPKAPSNLRGLSYAAPAKIKYRALSSRGRLDKRYHKTRSPRRGIKLFGIICRRTLAALPLLIVLSIVAFSIIKSLPGDPVDVMLGTAQRDIPPAQVALMRQELGLDQTPIQQYGLWLARIVTKGDFGRSYKDGRPALAVIEERLPATLALVLSSLFISFLVGVGWGLLMIFLKSAPNMAAGENLLHFGAIVLYSSPNFWVGLLLIAFLASTPQLSSFSLLGLHDPGSAATFFSVCKHMILPAIVLASRRTAKVALFVRASTLDELDKEYVLTARSKGLSRAQVLLKHVARNSLLPVASLVGLSLPALLGGSVLVETVFGWPGMGRLAVEATFARNYPIMLALILLYGVLVVFANLLADLIQTALDPRLATEASDTSPVAFGSARA